MTAGAALPPTLRIDAARARVRLSPTDPAFVADPYPSYRAIREACPLFVWEDYGHLCAADAATVDALFRDRRFGREAPGRPPPPEHTRPFHDLDALSMLEREPPAHTRLRRLVNRAFVSRAVERLRPRVEALADALLDAFPSSGPFDLLPLYAEPIPVALIAELLGVPGADAPHLLDWSHRMVAMYRPGRTRADEDAAVVAALGFSAYLRGHLAERRARPRDDLLTLLATAPASEISEDEAAANAALLLNAGHEATVHALGLAAASVLGSGLDPRALFATPERTAATVEEALRFEPPLHLFTRTCLEPARVAGVDFAPGTTVGLLIGAADRDPARWPAPDRFDPFRAPAAHVAFGGGIHFCLGAPLARLELEVALPRLFARRPRLRLAGEPRFADRYHFRALEALEVRG
ncbi:cytochrome P450 [Lichenibacterium dinghuense]|uniref:cytochrome P450 n=1 Tax=Lichenibacterium dinghuense TaxID=2895977 RepID=UPI001F405820|nr:cytochrome P450 [Lichenibacterium sp. 6Y81]